MHRSDQSIQHYCIITTMYCTQADHIKTVAQITIPHTTQVKQLPSIVVQTTVMKLSKKFRKIFILYNNYNKGELSFP